MLKMNKPQRIKKLKELGDIFTDFFGLYSNKRNFEYYFCNGMCKFKINSFPHGDLRIDEGNCVVLKNIKFDGAYKKPYTYKGFFWKNYAEVAFKHIKDFSRIETIDNLDNDIKKVGL